MIMTMMINYDDGNNDFDDGDINASAVSFEPRQDPHYDISVFAYLCVAPHIL